MWNCQRGRAFLFPLVLHFGPKPCIQITNFTLPPRCSATLHFQRSLSNLPSDGRTFLDLSGSGSGARCGGFISTPYLIESPQSLRAIWYWRIHAAADAIYRAKNEQRELWKLLILQCTISNRLQMALLSSEWKGLDFQPEMSALKFAYQSVMTGMLYLLQSDPGQPTRSTGSYLQSAREELLALVSMCHTAEKQTAVNFLNW